MIYPANLKPVRVSDLLDYSAEDLNGKSMYSLCHAADVDKIKQTHTDRKSTLSTETLTKSCISVIKKGQVMSTYFRLLNRRGGYTWMQMCATLVCNTKNENEQSILCVNYVLSGSQYSHVVMDQKQVDQPNVRIKRDEDAENQTGSPESRGEILLIKTPTQGKSQTKNMQELIVTLTQCLHYCHCTHTV